MKTTKNILLPTKYTAFYYIILGVLLINFFNTKQANFRRLNTLQAYSKYPINHSKTSNEIVNYRLMRRSIRYYKTLLNVYPQQQRSYDLLGYSYFHINHYPKSLRSYYKTLQINPRYYWSYFNIAVIYYKTGNYSKAIHFLKEGLKIDPQIKDQVTQFFNNSNPKSEQIIENLLLQNHKRLENLMQKLLLISFYKLEKYEEMLSYFSGKDIEKVAKLMQVKDIKETTLDEILPPLLPVINPLSYIIRVGLEEQIN